LTLCLCSAIIAYVLINFCERGVIVMPGTKKGGELAAKTNKLRHGSDFYARIGRVGGKNGTTGGFAANRELARIAGAKGGKLSRRTKKIEVTEEKIAA
jgi:general stress protein YciG